jgi:hypothetical protein
MGAAELIDARGWCQGASHGPVGELCMARAIGVAAAADREADDPESRGLADWNDDPVRTRAEVTRALRAAAGSLAVPA